VAIGIGGWLQPRALGVGYDVIGDLLGGRMLIGAALALLAAKAVMWVLALGSGTSGGVLAPVLMMGAGLGTVLAPWLPGGSPGLWPLVFMAAVLAGVLGAPLTAAVFAFGLTGDGDALLPLLLGCAVSHGVTVLLMDRSIMTERLSRRGRHVYREYGVDPLERTPVEAVMTRHVQTIPADAPLARVVHEWFGPAQRHRAFAVVDAAGACLGMLDRDRLNDMGGETRTAGDLLQGSAVQFALPHQTCRALSQQMAAWGLERLPVVQDEQTRRLVGIVSRSDLVKVAQAVHDEEAVRERVMGWKRS
jgi:CBS domain-containing protein